MSACLYSVLCSVFQLFRNQLSRQLVVHSWHELDLSICFKCHEIRSRQPYTTLSLAGKESDSSRRRLCEETRGLSIRFTAGLVSQLSDVRKEKTNILRKNTHACKSTQQMSVSRTSFVSQSPFVSMCVLPECTGFGHHHACDTSQTLEPKKRTFYLHVNTVPYREIEIKGAFMGKITG